MGFDCDLDCSGSIIYRAELSGGLIEHELDHVFTGRFAGSPIANSAEVAGWRWVGLTELLAERQLRSRHYTAWFWLVLEHVLGKGWPGPLLAFRDPGRPTGLSDAG
jgi:isopentenyl-diphosphate delta-isomerase